VDWYLDGDDASAVSLLRGEVMAYLRRHAEPESDLDAAELVFAEAVGNAVRHAAGPVWVSLTWHDVEPMLTVYDVGPGLDPRLLDDPERVRVADDPFAESGRGLFLMRELAPEVTARRRAEAGTVVDVRLPVRRAPALSHDPPRHRVGVLPALEEARPEGGFGKEAFLRALVVQLARSVALQHGPDAADAAVAQVGIDVGGQMEQEFRAAERVVGRLTPEQLGRCYVRLKHAIDGGFHVVEATEERIVLGNTRCPFGDAVRKAPALCRMTSSVFGGIAASNHPDGAAVLLEERIAVGDPGCRVVVLLGGSDPASPHAHVYRAPGAEG
jgi:anti-sigma regulatory factor (Ser/Thr protein kinase)